MIPAEIAGSPPVQRWLAKAGYEARPAECGVLVEELAAFCDFAGKDPAELITSCLRTTKAGETAISTKGRQQMQDLIDGFAAEKGLAGHAAIVAGNHIRGFLIHNGIFMQGRASIR